MIESLYSLIGGQHRFQYFTLILVVISQLNMAIHFLIPIFINNAQEFLCMVPFKESQSIFASNREQFKAFDNSSSFLILDQSQCSVNKVNNLCKTITMKQNVMTSTIINQYNLICERSYLASLSVLILMIGVLLGSLFGGVLVDRFGRVKGCFLSYYTLSVFVTIAALSPWFWLHVLARLLVGLAVSLGFISNSALILEVVATKNRTMFGFCWSLGYYSGYLMLVFLAYFIRNHCYLQYIATAVSYLTLVFPFFYKESFRWLLTHEYNEKAKETIQYIASFNKQRITRKEVEDIVEDYHNKKTKEHIQKVHLKEIFKHKVVLLNMIIFWFMNFSGSFSYYTFLLGSSKISHDLFLATTISAVLTLVFLLLIMMLCSRVGQVTILASLQSSLALMFITSIAMRILLGPSNIVTAVLLMVAIAISATTIGVLWIYGGEVFPTVIRSTSVSIGSACARVSAIIASQMDTVFDTSPLTLPIIGAIMSIVGTVCALFILPETRNRVSLDFLEQAEVAFVEWRQPWRRRPKSEKKIVVEDTNI